MLVTGLLSPAWGPLTVIWGSKVLRMVGIVRHPRPLKGPQKQRGCASPTVALLTEEPFLFAEEPERVIFIHCLHVTSAFFMSPISSFSIQC